MKSKMERSLILFLIFQQVLTSELCGIVVVTALAIGVLHFFLEKKEFSLEQFLWNSMTSIFFITTINLKRSGSRLIQISFWFMIMIISSTYLAKMTNILTIEQPLNMIKSPYDLNSKRVITYSIYNYQLYQFGAIPLTSDFGSSDLSVYDDISAEQIIRNLSRDDDYKVDAYIIDDIQAQYIEYTNCNIYLLGRSFYQFNYGIAFYKDQDTTTVSKINKEIQLLTINKSSEKQISEYIAKNYDQCVKDSKDDQITMDHVGGLFVIQAIAISVAILVFLITKVPLYKRLLRVLEKYNIVSEPKQQVKDVHGDELVLMNIKQVTKEQIMNFEQIIEDRLDEMDENIIKFYEILLNEEQLKKLKIIQESDRIYKKELSNSIQISKNDDSFQNASLKKIEKKENNFSQVFNELQISKHTSDIKYERQDTNHKPKTELKIIGEVEMAEFDNDQDSNKHFS